MQIISGRKDQNSCNATAEIWPEVPEVSSKEMGRIRRNRGQQDWNIFCR